MISCSGELSWLNATPAAAEISKLKTRLAQIDAGPTGKRAGQGRRAEAFKLGREATAEAEAAKAARAKANGVKLGRTPKLTAHQRREAIERRDAGEATRFRAPLQCSATARFQGCRHDAFARADAGGFGARLAIVRDGHEVVPAWRILAPDGDFLILTSFDPDQPEARARLCAHAALHGVEIRDRLRVDR